MLYLDSSALVKLVVTEKETRHLRRFLAAHADAVVTSALARVEVIRAARLVDASLVGDARESLARVDHLPVSPDLLAEAADLGPARLLSVDAIHLASALRLSRFGLTAFVAYDVRLLAAATSLGLPAQSPGTNP